MGAVAVVSVLGVSGCGRNVAEPASAPQTPVSEADGVRPSVPVPVGPGALPPPEALSDVIVRLADPAIPAEDKLPLVENTTEADAPVLDDFATALRDAGFTPVTVRASDIGPSGPGDVVATIRVTGADSGSGRGEFSFPMEFRRSGNGWQLTRPTADMLLAFGSAVPTAPTPPR